MWNISYNLAKNFNIVCQGWLTSSILDWSVKIKQNSVKKYFVAWSKYRNWRRGLLKKALKRSILYEGMIRARSVDWHKLSAIKKSMVKRIYLQFQVFHNALAFANILSWSNILDFYWIPTRIPYPTLNSSELYWYILSGSQKLK